ncbi:MAG: hypothetical protein U5J64_07030, partial [Halobacteriales archaeon]|nr:hypothetical protein [Halobacteriales archaeon]
TRLEIDAGGDAVFVLELRTVLDTDEKRAAFDEFVADVEENPEAAVSDFRGSVEPLVERASDETGREMSASNFTVETRREPVPVERGVVEYRFDWSGFAETDGGIHAGDVLSGYILGDGDVLVLRAPNGYVVSSAEPTPDDVGAVARWEGRRDFADDQPRVVFEPVSDTETDDTETATETTNNGGGNVNTDTNPDEETGIPVYVYAVALVVVLSVAAVVYRSRYYTAGGTEKEAPSVEEETAVTDMEETEDEQISDDERVLRMIESEEGKMKQKHVVEETGWSEAKVSKLTSRMEDEGMITKIRLGRENILEIRDEEEDDEPLGM